MAERCASGMRSMSQQMINLMICTHDKKMLRGIVSWFKKQMPCKQCVMYMRESRKVTNDYRKLTIHDDVCYMGSKYVTLTGKLYVEDDYHKYKISDEYGMLSYFAQQIYVLHVHVYGDSLYYFNELTDTWYDVIEKYDRWCYSGTWYMRGDTVIVRSVMGVFLFVAGVYKVTEVSVMNKKFVHSDRPINKNAFNAMTYGVYSIFQNFSIQTSDVFASAHEVSDIRRLKILLTKPQKICAWPNDVQVVCRR